MGELILKEPLVPGKGEIDQVNKIFKLLGRPTQENWPGFDKLPNAKSFNLSAVPAFVISCHKCFSCTDVMGNSTSLLRQRFRHTTEAGLDLMHKLLCYDPSQRITAQEGFGHDWFTSAFSPSRMIAS